VAREIGKNLTAKKKIEYQKKQNRRPQPGGKPPKSKKTDGGPPGPERLEPKKMISTGRKRLLTETRPIR